MLSFKQASLILLTTAVAFYPAAAQLQEHGHTAHRSCTDCMDARLKNNNIWWCASENPKFIGCVDLSKKTAEYFPTECDKSANRFDKCDAKGLAGRTSAFPPADWEDCGDCYKKSLNANHSEVKFCVSSEASGNYFRGCTDPKSAHPKDVFCKVNAKYLERGCDLVKPEWRTEVEPPNDSGPCGDCTRQVATNTYCVLKKQKENGGFKASSEAFRGCVNTDPSSNDSEIVKLCTDPMKGDTYTLWSQSPNCMAIKGLVENQANPSETADFCEKCIVAKKTNPNLMYCEAHGKRYCVDNTNDSSVADCKKYGAMFTECPKKEEPTAKPEEAYENLSWWQKFKRGFRMIWGAFVHIVKRIFS